MAGGKHIPPNYERYEPNLNAECEPGADGFIRGSFLGKGQQSRASELLAVASLGAFTAFPYFCVMLLLASWFSRSALALVVIVLTTMLLPKPVLWPPFTHGTMMLSWMEYFDFSWVCEERVADIDKNAILVSFPHGAVPLGGVLSSAISCFLYPGRKVFGLGATVLFRLPMYCHFMSWIGCVPASRKNLKDVLRKGPVTVFMGGIAEMFLIHEDHEEIMIHGRKGLVKTALETATPVVPVYYMGLSQVLSFGPQWMQPLSRRLRMSLGHVIGRWGLPVPRKLPICMVTGKVIYPEPLDKEPGEEGYQEALDAACERLTEKLAGEVRGLYERHRDVIPGWQERPLVIR